MSTSCGISGISGISTSCGISGISGMSGISGISTSCGISGISTSCGISRINNIVYDAKNKCGICYYSSSIGILMRDGISDLISVYEVPIEPKPLILPGALDVFETCISERVSVNEQKSIFENIKEITFPQNETQNKWNDSKELIENSCDDGDGDTIDTIDTIGFNSGNKVWDHIVELSNNKFMQNYISFEGNTVIVKFQFIKKTLMNVSGMVPCCFWTTDITTKQDLVSKYIYFIGSAKSKDQKAHYRLKIPTNYNALNLNSSIKFVST